jgi:hypothetical protein
MEHPEVKWSIVSSCCSHNRHLLSITLLLWLLLLFKPLFIELFFNWTWYNLGSTRWRSWLRHCATRRKVVGSVSDGVIEIFHWHNPSGRTMSLGLTQPVIETSTRNISWGLRCRADNLATFMCRLSWNLGASTSWNPLGLSRPVMGLLYLYVMYSWYWVVDRCEWLSKTDMQKERLHRQFPTYIRFVFPKLLRNPARHLFVTHNRLCILFCNILVNVHI